MIYEMNVSLISCELLLRRAYFHICGHNELVEQRQRASETGQEVDVTMA